MSVPKPRRGESKLEVLVKATALASYTVRICSNEKRFPKRYRWCLTNKIVDAAIDIDRYAVLANSIFLTNDQKLFETRREYQTKALSTTYSLLSLINIAYDTYHIDGKSIDYWVGLVVDVQNLIRKWRKSDEKRFYEKLRDS